jgi:hypothetical protein
MYLFTDNNLKETQYNYDNPSMFIECINSNYNEYENILKWGKSKNNIYYIGSSEGCGCGWRITYSYAELYDDEIKHYSEEIGSIRKKILEVNYENICYELIGNNIKYIESEISEIISFRKRLLENEIENCEYSIKKLKEYKHNRNDLYTFFNSMNFDGSFIILCWEGDQGEEIDTAIELNMEQIRNIDYKFKELVAYIL